ncbi:hypothetical protein [Pontibacter kalidii]|uniref:hypothetical protein n=1 Tax=Pontibacter kalidii TaxID=2592049 RepID=UPI0022529BAC|nr:hypothetical protein [Pontibacter kalidii]
MSQLNFFFDKKDIQKKVLAIIALNEAEVFRGSFYETDAPRPIGSIEELGEFESLVLWLRNGFREPKCSSKGSGEIERKYLFDYMKDPIIVIDNSTVSNNLMAPSRIYYKSGWVKNEELRKKHKDWATRIYKLFDKDTLKIKKTWRVSKSVEDWINSGGEIELGRGGLVLNREKIKEQSRVQ